MLKFAAMELKDIVSVGGVAGLHKVIGRNKNGLIVETIGENGKKFATNVRQKISVLADISIFTTDGEVRLWQAIKNIKEKEDAGTEIPTGKSSDAEIKSAMAFAVPNFDAEKVYISDMKKLFAWYQTIKSVIDYSKLGEEENEESADAEKNSTENAMKSIKEKAAPKQLKSHAPKTHGGAKSKTTTPRKMGS
jgi:hypothetical protein